MSADHITSGKQLATHAADLLDSDVERVMKIVIDIQERYSRRANTAYNLEYLRDEVLTRLMEIGILATFDPAPCLYGDPPDLEIIGRVDINDYGLDHDKKRHEILAANERGEDFLGQRGKSR